MALPQAGITICFTDGREEDIIGYLCEDNGQNYSMITESVRFPIRTGRESHMTLERSVSNLTHLNS